MDDEDVSGCRFSSVSLTPSLACPVVSTAPSVVRVSPRRRFAFSPPPAFFAVPTSASASSTSPCDSLSSFDPPRLDDSRAGVSTGVLGVSVARFVADAAGSAPGGARANQSSRDRCIFSFQKDRVLVGKLTLTAKLLRRKSEREREAHLGRKEERKKRGRGEGTAESVYMCVCACGEREKRARSFEPHEGQGLRDFGC